MEGGGGNKKRYQYCTDSTGANLVPPSSSRSFRKSSNWFYFARQCRYSGRFLPMHSSCCMCNQSSFHHQFGVDTKGSKFEQQTDSVSACWSHGQTRRILIRLAWMHRVVHNPCIMHGRNIKTQCIGSTSTLLWRKVWSCIKHGRTLSFFTKHSQLIVFWSLLGWKLEMSHTRSKMRHLGLQRSPWKMTGLMNWFRSCPTTRTGSCSTSKKVPNQPNQLQTQIMIGRGVPLSGAHQGPRQVEEKRPVPRKSKHLLLMKKLLDVIERRHPLSAVTQVTSQERPKHVHLMTARALPLKVKQHMIERGKLVVGRDTSLEPKHEQSMPNEVNIDFRIRGLPHSVVKQAQNSRVRELVKKIEKTKPTTRSVRW